MDWLETHQVIQWVTPDDMASKELAEKYRIAVTSQDYSIYSQARDNVESGKFREGYYGISKEQLEQNQRIDQILSMAWEQLEPSEQKSILDLQPAGNDFMNVIDQKVQTENYYSDDYMNYQKKNNSLKLWKSRLESAVRIGKNFVIKLSESFFNSVAVSEDDTNYFELFNLYESYSS